MSWATSYTLHQLSALVRLDVPGYHCLTYPIKLQYTDIPDSKTTTACCHPVLPQTYDEGILLREHLHNVMQTSFFADNSPRGTLLASCTHNTAISPSGCCLYSITGNSTLHSWVSMCSVIATGFLLLLEAGSCVRS